MYSLEELKDFFKGDTFATNLLGAKIIDVKEGYAKCEFEINDNHKNAKGFVMGGAIFTLADFAFAVATNQNEAYYTVSVNANINYLIPATGKRLYAEANCIKDGKQICFYEVKVFNDDKKLVSKLEINGNHIYKN